MLYALKKPGSSQTFFIQCSHKDIPETYNELIDKVDSGTIKWQNGCKPKRKLSKIKDDFVLETDYVNQRPSNFKINWPSL